MLVLNFYKIFYKHIIPHCSNLCDFWPTVNLECYWYKCPYLWCLFVNVFNPDSIFLLYKNLLTNEYKNKIKWEFTFYKITIIQNGWICINFASDHSFLSGEWRLWTNGLMPPTKKDCTNKEQNILENSKLTVGLDSTLSKG